MTAVLVLTRIERLLREQGRDQRRPAYQASHDVLTGLIDRRRLFAEAKRVGESFRAGAPLLTKRAGQAPEPGHRVVLSATRISKSADHGGGLNHT